MEHEQKVAMIRGMIIAVITAGVTFFGTWQAGLSTDGVTNGDALSLAGIATGLSFFTALLVRYQGEGTVDAARGADERRR